MKNIEYSTKLLDLPTAVRGFVKESPDGWYTVVLNSRLTHESNLKTFHHELAHIERGDFESEESVDLIESRRHS